MTLYKYVVPDRTDVLKNNLIRFTQASSLNDPFETRPAIEALLKAGTAEPFVRSLLSSVDPDDANFHRRYDQSISEAVEGLPDEAEQLVHSLISREEALSMAQEIAGPFLEAFVSVESTSRRELVEQELNETLREDYGMLSLTEKPDNLLMWAHYADSHRGFIIGLDAEHSFFDQRSNERDRVRAVKEVQYLKDRPSFEGLDLGDDEQQQIDQLASIFFFTKSDHWRYESEWRMLLGVEDAETTLSEPGDTIHLFSLPAKAITSVIFGCQTPGALKGEVWQIIQGNERYDHVELHQARMDAKRFRVNISNLRRSD